MGSARVTLTVDDAGHQAIDKYPVSEVEFAFYQHTAARLNQAGIATPALLSADPGLRKLRLEYLPCTLDQTAVAADEILAMLGRLHGYPRSPEWLYHRHGWSETALEKTLRLLALPDRTAQQLRSFQRASDVLFNDQTLISGDSNAGNWGKRESGEIVLFDWERFGTGSPAIDLAPLIKGMGSREACYELAGRYCRITGQHNASALAREIVLAKAWIVSEVMILLNTRQKPSLAVYRDWYNTHLPDWLDSVVEML